MASTAPIHDDGDPNADRRVYPRVPLALPAFIQANGERHSVQLLDLSLGGAKLNCPMKIPTGTAVILDCGSFCGGAVVRWQNGDYLGVCFDHELDGREVTALIARSTALATRMNARE